MERSAWQTSAQHAGLHGNAARERTSREGVPRTHLHGGEAAREPCVARRVAGARAEGA